MAIYLGHLHLTLDQDQWPMRLLLRLSLSQLPNLHETKVNCWHGFSEFRQFGGVKPKSCRKTHGSGSDYIQDAITRAMARPPRLDVESASCHVNYECADFLPPQTPTPGSVSVLQYLFNSVLGNSS